VVTPKKYIVGTVWVVNGSINIRYWRCGGACIKLVEMTPAAAITEIIRRKRGAYAAGTHHKKRRIVFVMLQRQ
jgi:hypothetical protein